MTAWLALPLAVAAPEPSRAVPPPPSASVPSEDAVRRQSEVTLDDPSASRRGRYRPPGSKQRFAIEAKVGPYVPDVDRNYSGPGLGPYATIFGPTNDRGEATRAPRWSLMGAVAFEWQFLYLAGPLLLGTQVGFFRDSAQALLADPESGEGLRSSADRVTFGMVPISVQLGYRFELLADRFRVPLVPYAKFGPTYAFWWSLGGNGDLSRNSEGEEGRGGVWGWQLNAGGMLRLDFIEPGTAKKLDQTTGINHTYVFGEYQFSRIDNFGADRAISLGDGTWFVGFAVEF